MASRSQKLVGGAIGMAVVAATVVALVRSSPHPASAATPVAAPFHEPEVATTLGAGPVAAVRLAQTSAASRSFRSPTGSHVATVDNGTLNIDGTEVATAVGAVAWASDGSAVFFTAAPPLSAPMTPEPLYVVRPGSGAPQRLGVSADPWRLSVTGASSVAFDDGGVLAIGNALGNTVVKTAIALNPVSSGQPPPAYPFSDTVFVASPNEQYVAVAGASNRVTMYHLANGSIPAGAVIPATGTALPGTIGGNRDEWGAWNQNSTEFLYSVDTSGQAPRLELWSSATSSVTELAGALAPNSRGQYLILGWLNRAPTDFLLNLVPPAPSQAGAYVVGNTQGQIVQTLWHNGFGGVLSADQTEVTFEASPDYGAAPELWTATIWWGVR